MCLCHLLQGRHHFDATALTLESLPHLLLQVLYCLLHQVEALLKSHHLKRVQETLFD